MKILKVTGIILGALLGLIVLYLSIVIFAPGFDIPEQPLPIAGSAAGAFTGNPPMSRQEVSFEVGGLTIRAWLYLPQDLFSPVPCIVMNHGFGGTKDMVLEAYASRFQESGVAVLTYDYRYFGESEGDPRQLFAISYQLEDCKGAVAYARSLKEIDPDKIALWGTSAGGCYGPVIAAQDKKISCVVAQCSGWDIHKDGRMALEREGIGFFLRLFMHAQRDKGRSRFGLSAHKIPIVGKPGTLAMIVAPGAFEGYARLASPGFVNEVCARTLLMTGGFNPMDHVKDVECPVLIQICERDNLVSMSAALKAAEILGSSAEVHRYPIGHFDIYSGEYFEKSVSDQIGFFKEHL